MRGKTAYVGSKLVDNYLKKKSKSSYEKLSSTRNSTADVDRSSFAMRRLSKRESNEQSKRDLLKALDKHNQDGPFDYIDDSSYDDEEDDVDDTAENY